MHVKVNSFSRANKSFKFVPTDAKLTLCLCGSAGFRNE